MVIILISLSSTRLAVLLKQDLITTSGFDCGIEPLAKSLSYILALLCGKIKG